MGPNGEFIFRGEGRLSAADVESSNIKTADRRWGLSDIISAPVFEYPERSQAVKRLRQISCGRC